MFYLLGLLSITVFAAEPTPFIQDQIYKLEQLRTDSRMFTDDKAQELSELYFLTGRCKEVLKIKKKFKNLITCACGGACPNPQSSEDEAWVQVFSLKKSAEKGEKWNSVEVKKKWQKIKENPNAKYWAFKILGSSAKQDPVLRTQLERALESYNVNP